MLAGCVPAATPPVAVRPAVAAPMRGPVATLAAAPLDWRDAPLASGTWTWRDRPTSTASFGQVLSLTCDRDGKMTLAAPTLSGPLTVLTTDLTWAIGVGPVRLSARDPLLDAIAFTRGRFAILGRGRLIVPTGPEFARAVEDCR